MRINIQVPFLNSQIILFAYIGLDFGAVYQVMVVAVNNEDFGGQSGMHKVTTAVGNCEYSHDFESILKGFWMLT